MWGESHLISEHNHNPAIHATLCFTHKEMNIYKTGVRFFFCVSAKGCETLRVRERVFTMCAYVCECERELCVCECMMSVCVEKSVCVRVWGWNVTFQISPLIKMHYI